MSTRPFIPSYVRRYRYTRDGIVYEVQLAIDEEALFTMMARRVTRGKSGKARALSGAIQVKIVTPARK